jgi:hypothetical protein
VDDDGRLYFRVNLRWENGQEKGLSIDLLPTSKKRSKNGPDFDRFREAQKLEPKTVRNRSQNSQKRLKTGSARSRNVENRVVPAT